MTDGIADVGADVVTDLEDAGDAPSLPPVFDCYCDFPKCTATASVEVGSADADRYLLPKGWGRFLVQVAAPEDPWSFDLCPEHFRAEVRGWMLEDPTEVAPTPENRKRTNVITAAPVVVIKPVKKRLSQKDLEPVVDILEALEPKVVVPVEEQEEPELPEDEEDVLFWHPPSSSQRLLGVFEA